MPRFEILTEKGNRAEFSARQAPSAETRKALEALADAAAERMALIDTCHERVACPKCGAPVGERCHKLSSKPLATADPGRRRLIPPIEAKHPHEERWRQEVPPR